MWLSEVCSCWVVVLLFVKKVYCCSYRKLFGIGNFCCVFCFFFIGFKFSSIEVLKVLVLLVLKGFIFCMGVSVLRVLMVLVSWLV